MNRTKLIILGNNGNLSLSIQEGIKNLSHVEAKVIPSVDIRRVDKKHDFLDLIVRQLGDSDTPQTYVVNTCGLVSPEIDSEMLSYANVELNFELAAAAVHLGIKFVSFGSIMELFPDICHSNPYLNSKLTAFRMMQNLPSEKILHFRLHTLYAGRRMHPKMFLSQLYEAVRSNKDFHMTPGNQLREYHHIDDDVDLVLKLIDRGITGTIEVSHGLPQKLIEIATQVYSVFLPHRNVISDLANPLFEQFEHRFEKSPLLENLGANFRHPQQGIVDYFNILLREERKGCG